MESTRTQILHRDGALAQAWKKTVERTRVTDHVKTTSVFTVGISLSVPRYIEQQLNRLSAVSVSAVLQTSSSVQSALTRAKLQ